MADAEDTSGRLPALSTVVANAASKRKDVAAAAGGASSSTTTATSSLSAAHPHARNVPVGGMSAMQGSALMGSSAQQAILAGGVAGGGPQEWEWLTMSL